VSVLSNKVALVTGAGRGIGRAIAVGLAQHGASVAVVDNGSSIDGSGSNPELAHTTAEEITSGGGTAKSWPCDITSGAEVEATVADVEAEFGGIDVLINAAGIYRLATISSITEEAWDSVLNVHLNGLMFMTKTVVESLIRRGSPGRVINFTSLSGTAGLPNQIAYSTAKSGVIGFTKALANELFHVGITANGISPSYSTRMAFKGAPAHYQVRTHADRDAALEKVGSFTGSFTDSEMNPSNIVPLIVYLASDAASSVTGQIFGANGWRYSRLSDITEASAIVSRGGWTIDQVSNIFPNTLAQGMVTPGFLLDSLEVVSDTDISAARVEQEFSDEGRA
jgi:3-oxoacyl-[acyl-carrier protein] reductase